MPRRHRHRTMKGGFLESLTQGASDLWKKTKDATTSAYNSATSSTTSSSTYVPPPATYVPPPPATTSSSSYMGGRMRGRMRGRMSRMGGRMSRMGGRKRSRKMRGGYGDNIPLTGLASSAAPISDIKNAQPLNIVGGRRTKRHRRHRHSKSCKRCKY